MAFKNGVNIQRGEKAVGDSYHFEPKVSIIIPVYNGSNYLKEAIESALAQTYKNTEVIVINDGSNDGGKTQAIINAYGKRIRGYYQPNSGVAAALNLGIDMMTGEYFSWLSHDDLYTPNKIASQINKLREVGNPKAIIYSGYRTINELGEEISVYDPAQMYSLAKYTHPLFPVLRLMVNGCTVLFHKSHFQRTGGFDSTLKTTQDYDMWFKLFREQIVIYCPEIEVISRQHAAQGSRAAIEYHVQECETLWLRMLKSLSRDEIDHIDDNAYAFFINTHHFLKVRTLYKKTIAYAELEALKQLRRLLLEGSSYDSIMANQINPFEKDSKLQGLLHYTVFLDKMKTRIAFYAYAKKSIGGLMKMLEILAEGLADDYEIFLFYRKDEGILYERKDNMFYIQIDTEGDWENRLAKYMVVLGIDLFIGAHNCLEYFINMYMTLKNYGIKCIAWNHEDYNFTKINTNYYRVGESRKAIFHQLDAVVWINKASKMIYDQEAKNGYYIPDCIDVDPNHVILQPKEPFSLIAVGRYDDTIKRLDRVLEAFAYISFRKPEAKLYIAGDIHLDTQLAVLNNQTPRERMKQLGIKLEKVIFTGWITDVSPYYARSTIQLSTSESEGFGLIILEAASYSVPTIAFSNGGSDTIITDGKDGYIVRDIKEMVDRTLLLMEDQKLYRQMSMQSKWLVQKYTKDATILEWKKLLEKVINNKSGEVNEL